MMITVVKHNQLAMNAPEFGAVKVIDKVTLNSRH
jgi:hypothetical protein